MSHYPRVGTGNSRGRKDSNEKREYENDNPHQGSPGVALFRSSNASDIFRDHDFEETLQVPNEQLKRLSFHDISVADPKDLPLPLNIRKTPTPGNTPQKHAFSSAEGSTRNPAEPSHILTGFEKYLANPHSVSEESQRFLGQASVSSTEHRLQRGGNLSGLTSRCSASGSPADDGMLPTSLARDVRTKQDEGPGYSQTHSSSSSRDNVLRGLPRQQVIIPLLDDPDINDNESVASGDTITQEEYSSSVAQRSMPGLRKPKDSRSLSVNPNARGYRKEEVESAEDSEHADDGMMSRSDSGESSDETVRNPAEPRYLEQLHLMFGELTPGADLLEQPEPTPFPFDTRGMTDQQIRDAWTLRPVSSVFSFDLDDSPYPHAGGHSRNPTICSEQSASPSEIIEGYKREIYNRRAEERAQERCSGEGNEDEAEPTTESSGFGRLIEANNYPGSAQLRPNPRALRPSRIPRPVKTFPQVNTFPEEEEEEQEVQDEYPELEAIPEDVKAEEENVPEPPKMKVDKGKGNAKASEKKPKGREEEYIDPWALMVTGSSTPHRAKKQKRKSSGVQSESQSFSSSTRSKTSTHSDRQPSSPSDQPLKVAKRGAGKPNPIKSVIRKASGILPKFLHSPSTRSHPSTSETHKDSNPNSNQRLNTNTQEHQQQHQLTTTPSSSTASRHPTRLRSATTVLPSPFEARPRLNIGFPAPLPPLDCISHNPRSSALFDLSQGSPGHHTMAPPTREPPPIPSMFRRVGVVATTQYTDGAVLRVASTTTVHQATPTGFDAVQLMNVESFTNEVADTDITPRSTSTSFTIIVNFPQATAAQVDIDQAVTPEVVPQVTHTENVSPELMTTELSTTEVTDVEATLRATGTEVTSARTLPQATAAQVEHVEPTTTEVVPRAISNTFTTSTEVTSIRNLPQATAAQVNTAESTITEALPQVTSDTVTTPGPITQAVASEVATTRPFATEDSSARLTAATEASCQATPVEVDTTERAVIETDPQASFTRVTTSRAVTQESAAKVTAARPFATEDYPTRFIATAEPASVEVSSARTSSSEARQTDEPQANDTLSSKTHTAVTTETPTNEAHAADAPMTELETTDAGATEADTSTTDNAQSPTECLTTDGALSSEACTTETAEATATEVSTTQAGPSEATFTDDNSPEDTENEETGSNCSGSTRLGGSSSETLTEDVSFELARPDPSANLSEAEEGEEEEENEDNEEDGEDEEGEGDSESEDFESEDDALDEAGLPRGLQALYQAVEELSSADKINFLRQEIGCQHVWWTPDQQLPMRPSDGRIWHSKNLRCDRCSSDCCVCRAPCCKWKEAGNVLADDSSKESDKEVAGRLLQLLQEVMPRGVDPTTHVQCSTPGGCGLFACPDCAGRCPTALCQDIQCKNCKPDPWGECDWH